MGPRDVHHGGRNRAADRIVQRPVRCSRLSVGPASDDDGLWIDFDAIPTQAGALSSGERALLLIAASIGGSSQVNLGDGVCSLDHRHLGLVLAALAHANGSHRHSTTGFKATASDSPFPISQSCFPSPE